MRSTTRISTREAIRRICELHMIGKVEANRVLTAGLAGPGQRAGSAVLYDERQLASLLARPRSQVRPLADLEEQAEVVRRNWYVPPLLGTMLDRWGCLDGRRFPLEHGPTVTVWGAPTNGPLREVDWLRVDAEKQKEQIEYEMWLRSAPALRDVAQVGLTSAEAVLRAWNAAGPPRPETGRDGAAAGSERSGPDLAEAT